MKTPAFHSDEELLKQLSIGDADAYSEIYKKYWYRFFLVAYQRVLNKEVAQELTQNLFLKLWEKRSSLKIRHLENYLFISIKHAVIDYLNAQLVISNYLEYCKVFSSLKEETTERMVALEEVENAMEGVLMKLPEKSREVFRLSRLNHWPADKIADHLHLSEKAVQYHLTKSLKFLRTHLKEFTFSLLIFVFN